MDFLHLLRWSYGFSFLSFFKVINMVKYIVFLNIESFYILG